MSVKIGNTAINKIYLGSTEIKKAYLGSTLVYDKTAATGYLLDTYTGAAAAYSLRQLKTGVTNVVRVRRSSDNAESDFTATQVTDGTLTTWTGANDGFVVTWYDQSGNAVNLTQSTTSAQRQIVSSGSLILENGKPCLSGSASTFLTGFGPVITNVYSGFFVFKTPNITASWSLIYKGANDRFIGGDQFSTLRGFFRAGNTYNPAHNTLYTNNAQQLITHIRPTSTTSNAYKNGSANGSNTVTTGNGAFSSGHSVGIDAPTMQEIIVWGTDQSSNRAAIETLINSYYGIY